ncbi:GDSL-type esterase/lipase family protein [Niveibacterium microcysteis]|uniref:SGNH hydrolase-type esterase domain-containing protein n=1 Tax=Niveibacterium microcysteis TaxID=2811415 RepID=A0ABX7M5Y8_9RHOO|nr:GDSL-type esterase/lipase family protein [Niveibacterium microcysteis]QSI77168.1 hypothetical protein JY500_00515 [Niveibacterium microcysteis]
MAHDLVLLAQALQRSAKRLALIGLLLPLCGLSSCGGGGSDAQTTPPSAPMSIEAPTWLNSGVRVMALGDSLTEGWPATYGGYRFELYRRFIAAKLPVDFVGSVTNASYGLPDPNHEGHGGWTSYDLRDGRPNGLDNGNVRNWLGAWHPQVILLLAGTNDVFYTQGDDTIAANLLALIDRIREVAPDAELFVGSTLPLADPGLAARVVRFNAIVQQGLATRMQLDPHLHSVPTHDALSIDDLADDGVHIRPEGPGNGKLADAWFSAIRSTLERLSTH